MLGVGTTRSPSVLDDDHTVFGYTAAHLLNSVRRPNAFGSTATPTPVVSMVYDSSERVTSQTDQLGHRTTFDYGPNTTLGLAAGQTLITDPAGHKTLDTYSNGLLASQTKGFGTSDAGTTTYTYDPVTLGVSTITDPDGNYRTYTYDDHGNRISASDPRGYTTTYQYDARDNLVVSTDPTGLQTRYGYDEAGHIKTATGSNDGTVGYGLPTTVTRQLLDQPAEIPDGNPPTVTLRTESYFYDDAGHPGDLSRVVDARGFTTTMAYDSAGDLASNTDPLNNVTKYGYDTARGLRTSEVSPAGVAAGVAPGCTPPAKGCTTYAYDAWGRVTTTTDALGHTDKVGYDADGNKTSAIDGNNQKTVYTYDFADRQTVVTRPDTTTEKTDYNADDTIADTIDGANHKTTFGYDNQGRRTTRTDPGNRTTTWRYDPAGLVTSIVDAANRTTTYGYNASGLQTTISYSDGSTPNVTASGYDGAGRRTSMTDGTGTSTWTYDGFGEVLSQANGNGSTVGYSYDADGNITTISYPGGAGRTVTRTFDKDDRLSTVVDWNSKTTTFGYDADGNQNAVTYPNTTTVGSTFDNADEITGSTLKAGTTTLASLTSPRDADGQVSGETPSGVPGTAATYTYTSLEQIKTSGSTSYAYDAGDNPVTLGTTTQTFDATDQLCWSSTGTPPASPACASPPTGATTYTFDGVGDRKTATTGGAATTYTYDQGGRLTGYGKTGTTAGYTYNGAGTRTAKTVNGASTPYTWDIAQNLLYDGTTAYLYGPGGVPFEQIGPSATQWYFHDQLGSTRALTDASGAVVGGYAYTPWGAVSVHSGTASTPLQFTGQYTDAESGLVYLRARYYDPATAQFLTIDPLVEMTHSPYAYVDGNPLNGTDPSGLCGFWCKVGVGAVIGAVVVGTIACAIAEPCGAIELGGGLALAGAGSLGAGLSISVSGGVVAAAAGGAAAGAGAGAVYSMANDGSSSSSSDSGGNGDDDQADCADNRDLSNNYQEMADRFHATTRQIRDAIHAAKRDPIVRSGNIRNPDVSVDLDTGEIYIKLPDGSASDDSIGNIWDYLPEE